MSTKHHHGKNEDRPLDQTLDRVAEHEEKEITQEEEAVERIANQNLEPNAQIARHDN